MIRFKKGWVGKLNIEGNIRMEITVKSSDSAEPGLNFVAAAFQKETGHAVRISYDLNGINEGAAFDVLVATTSSIKKEFFPSGHVVEGGIVIGRAGLGITVRAGAALPDLSSVDALKRAVLEAESILYTTESSGMYIEGMLKKIGIYEQVEAKITRDRKASDLIDHVLNGKGRQLAVLSINAIRTHQGLALAGPLPEEVQYYREFMAVPSSRSVNQEVAGEFARFCGGPGKALLLANGFN